MKNIYSKVSNELIDSKDIINNSVDELCRQTSELQTDTELLNKETHEIRKQVRINRIISILYALLATILMLLIFCIK